MEFALNDPATRERIEQSIPLGRVGGAEDVAGVALFLCDRAAAYISGAIIPLDGGAAAARRRPRPPNIGSVQDGRHLHRWRSYAALRENPVGMLARHRRDASRAAPP